MSDHTRYERARMIGARSLQIAMGAPVFVEAGDEDPRTIAKRELKKGKLPITVKES